MSTVTTFVEDPENQIAAFHATYTRALRDFRYFCVEVMGFNGSRGLTAEQIAAGERPATGNDHDFRDPAYDPVFEKLQGDWMVMDGLLMLPRGTGKTTLVALWCLWRALKDPNISIMIDTHKESVGVTILDNMIRQWMLGKGGGWLAEVFGPQGCLPDPTKDWGTKTALMFPRRTTTRRDPTIFVQGADQGGTGFHPDVCVGEDLVNEMTVSSGELERIKKHWHAMAYQALSGKDARRTRLLVGTAWSVDDLYMDKVRDEAARAKAGEKPACVILRLPCRVAREDGTYDDDCVPRFRHLTDEALRDIKNDDNKGINLYAGQMDLDPIDPANKMFKERDLRRAFYIRKQDRNLIFVPGETEGSGRTVRVDSLYTVLFSDLAGSSGESKDRTAHVVLGVDHLRHVFVLAVEAGRFMPDENLDRMWRLYSDFRCAYIGAEGGVLRTVYEPLIKNWNAKNQDRRMAFRVVESGGARGNAGRDRALRIQPLVAKGEFHLHADFQEALEEFCKYSGVDNSRDDIVAATAIGVRRLRAGDAPAEAPKAETRQEKIRRQWAELHKRMDSKMEDSLRDAGAFREEVAHAA